MRYRGSVQPRAKKVSAVIAVAFAIAGMSQGCRTATQMELVVTYDGKCSDLEAVGFIIGTDPVLTERRIDTNLFTTSTSQCEPGNPSRVGTLVITPNDATSRASVIVLGAIGQRVEDCKPEQGYAGCILARRTFGFVDHTALTLDIPLEVDCKSVPCDAVSTCKHASCVSSTVECSDSGCNKPGDPGDGGLVTVDAPTSSDAYVMGDHPVVPEADATMDAPMPSDGAFDAPPDAHDDGSVVTADSGLDGGSCVGSNQPVTCMTSVGPKTCLPGASMCCYGAGAADGGVGGVAGAPGYDCRSACTVMPPNYNVQCKSSANCAPGSICCLNGGGAQCYAGKDCALTGGSQACVSSCECAPAKTCTGFASVGSAPTQTFQTCQ